MPIIIQMPALSPTMEVGNLVKWLKKEGDIVQSGEVIAEIETDKALMEFESADEGILAKILVNEGSEGVKVNEPIAIILKDGETLENIESEDKISNISISTEENAIIENEEKNITKETKEIKKVEVVTSQNNTQDNKTFISPLAKRLAHSNNIDTNQIKGTGPNGRIIKKDIQLLIDSGEKATQSRIDNLDQVSNNFDPSNYSVEKVDNIRNIISTRLQESNLTIPSYSINVDASIINLNKSRANMNSDLTENENRISINHFLIKITSLALINTPQVNTTWADDAILKHSNTDIGLAVSLENGLITPIIKNVQSKALREIRDETNELVLRAREKKLNPDEYQGGTISISNLGSYGIKSFNSIINPPQSSILSIGSSRSIPVVKDNAITIDEVISITLTTDHRLIDGAIAAEFLIYIKQLIENPDLMHL